VAEGIAALPDGAVIAERLADYAALREQARGWSSSLRQGKANQLRLEHLYPATPAQSLQLHPTGKQ
jgi:hypothetical protein